MTESHVELVDIMLDKTIKIVDGTAKLPSDGRKKYVCTICRKRFLTSKELHEHRPTHEKNEDEAEEDDDVIIISEKPRKKLVPVKKTKPTPKTTPVKNTIKNYFQKAEKIEKTEVAEEARKHPLLFHKCETCDSDFTSVDDIKLHTASTCRFKCGVCHKTYNTVYAFTVHALQHKINLFNTSFMPDKLHKCSLCPESFDDYIDLKTHSIVKHKTKAGSQSRDDSGESPDETNGDNMETEISCELCFDIFESEEKLLEHMEFHKELGEKPEKRVQEEHSADNEESSGKLIEEDDSKSPEDPAIVAEECMTRKMAIKLNPIPVIESSYSLAVEEPAPPAEPVEERKGEEEKTAEEPKLKYIVLPANDMIPKKHYKCNTCERIYTSIEEFDSHIPTKCKIENVCPVCLTTISTNSEWYTHITEKHRRWATCKYCFETFNEIKKLDQHKAMKHFNTFKNVCKICYKSFATYEEFDEHLKKEHLNLSADSSGKLSLKEKLTKYGITKEIVVLLQDVKLDKNFEFDGNTAIINDERKKKFTCYVCMAKFPTSQSMNKHKAMHSDSELEDDPRDEETWSGPKNKGPPQNTYSRPNLKPKNASVTEDMNKICDKTKRDETAATNQNQKATPFKCETCDVFFESSDDAKLHTVSNKCKFLCKICGRKFNTLYAFVVHVMQHRSNAARSHGSTQMVYTCATCKQTFDNCLLLRSHEINSHAPKPNSVAPSEPEPVIDEPKELNATVKEEPMEPPVQDQVPANNAVEEETNEICCELCYDIFESEEELKAHMEFHEQLENKSDTIVIEDDEDEVVEVFEEKKAPHEIITTIKSTPRPPQQKKVKPPKVRPGQATAATASLKTKPTHTLTAAIKDMLIPRTEKQSKTILLPPVSLPSLIPVNKLKKKVAKAAAKTNPQSGGDNPNLELRRTGPLSYSFCFKEDGTVTPGTSSKITTTTSSVTATTSSPMVSIKVPISATVRNSNRTMAAPSTSSASKASNGPNLQFFITNVPYAPTLQTAGTSTASTVTDSTIATTSSTLTSSTSASNFAYVVAPTAAFAAPIVVNDPKSNLAYVILPHTNTGIITPTTNVQTSECVITPQLRTTNTLPTIDLTEARTSTVPTTTTNTTSNEQSKGSVDVTTTPIITNYFTTSDKSTDETKASSLPVIADCFTANDNPEETVKPTPFPILSDYLVASGNSEGSIANTTEGASTATTTTTNVSNKENEESIVIDSDSSTEDNPKEQAAVKDNTGNESESDELVIDESASTEPSTSQKKDDGVAETQEEEEKPKKKKYKFPMKCEGCSVIFLRMRSMRHHLERRHSCQLCEFKCCKLSDLKQHYIQEHHKHFCSRCSILSNSRRSFTEHNRRNHICQLCNGFYFNLTHHTCPKVGENDKNDKDDGKNEMNDGKNDKEDDKNEKDDGKNEKKE